MIKDYIIKIEYDSPEVYKVYFNELKPIKYYVYKNKNNFFEFCELDKNGRFINRNTTDFILTKEEFNKLRLYRYNEV
jgi:hypothetical protein